MYQTDFICTYTMFSDISHDDQEELYRIQLLQAFDLKEWNDDKINETIEELYSSISSNDCFKDVFLKAKQNTDIIQLLEIYMLNSGENETLDENEIIYENNILFKLLFKFEYFHLTHRCIIDFILNKSIDNKYINNLLEIL